MKFDSYIVSDTKTAFSVPIERELLPKKSLKQKAFTLAETLITLSIIGVVAAMTVPTLMANTQKQGYVTGVKKAYSNLQNVMKKLPMELGCSNGDYSCLENTVWGQNVDNWGFEILSEQFKLAKKVSECEYSISFGNHSNSTPVETRCFQTTGGMLMFDSLHYDNLALASIGIDINGDKGPNKIGRDIFFFQLATVTRGNIQAGTVLADGSRASIDYFDVGYFWKEHCTAENFKKNAWWGNSSCTARVLETGKMDY